MIRRPIFSKTNRRPVSALFLSTVAVGAIVLLIYHVIITRYGVGSLGPSNQRSVTGSLRSAVAHRILSAGKGHIISKTSRGHNTDKTDTVNAFGKDKSRNLPSKAGWINSVKHEWNRNPVGGILNPVKDNRDLHSVDHGKSAAFASSGQKSADSATWERNDVSVTTASQTTTTTSLFSGTTAETSAVTTSEGGDSRRHAGAAEKDSNSRRWLRQKTQKSDEDLKFQAESDFRQAETSGLNPQSAMHRKPVLDPQKLYLIRSCQGRLGNVMFQFATAFCIALKNNLTLIVKDKEEMNNFRYQGIKVADEFINNLPISPVQSHGEKACCGFDPRLMNLKPAGHHHRLRGYTQSWKYFEPCKEEVRNATLFTQRIVIKALDIIRNLRQRFLRKVLVGIHVRMEDHTRARAVKNGKTVAPPDYYIGAMTYFRKRFRDIIFVVIAANSNWFKTEVTNTSYVTFLGRSDSAAVDMEVLSRLDHLIISVGTFGWWAGYKSNGTVVCYKDFFRPQSHYGEQFLNNATDYIYPGWILL